MFSSRLSVAKEGGGGVEGVRPALLGVPVPIKHEHVDAGIQRRCNLSTHSFYGILARTPSKGRKLPGAQYDVTNAEFANRSP